MSTYTYEYDSRGSFTRDLHETRHSKGAPYLDPMRYDDFTRGVIAKNVAESMKMDALRAKMGPTSEQLRKHW